ncbi:N-acetyltransferase family protein [Halobaculum sp. MBLA0143]|uniref:GNAT family N-acetyltransferase n=1 Tax=Halobaculum sp. MBLA0143 TaxID=3079933 RepID=UPI003526679B
MNGDTEETATHGPSTGVDGREPPAGTSVDLPHTATDRTDREVVYRVYEPSDRAAVRALHDSFQAADRSQGVPPADDDALDEWLSSVLSGPSVVAWHDGTAVGHLALVPDRSGEHELGLFVAADYREAGVGTELLRSGLAHARETAVSSIWLSVARTNEDARRLFRRAGFVETTETAFTVYAARAVRE